MAQNKIFRKTVELREVPAAVVTVDISVDLWVTKGDEPRPALEVYKNNWLKLSNHKRETPEILSIENFMSSNLVDVTLNIEDDTLEHAIDFCSQFGKVVDSYEETVLIHDLDGYYDRSSKTEYAVYAV